MKKIAVFAATLILVFSMETLAQDRNKPEKNTPEKNKPEKNAPEKNTPNREPSGSRRELREVGKIKEHNDRNREAAKQSDMGPADKPSPSPSPSGKPNNR